MVRARRCVGSCGLWRGVSVPAALCELILVLARVVLVSGPKFCPWSRFQSQDEPGWGGQGSLSSTEWGHVGGGRMGSRCDRRC